MQGQLQSCLRGAVAIGALTLLSAGCSTPTTITDVQRDPGYTAGPMRSLVIFGGRLNDTNRRTLEESFVSALAQHGVRATASYTIFPTLPSKEAAQAAMQEVGADGYLVASMHGTSEQTVITPGYPGAFWDGYYGPGWGGAWDPAYVETNEFVKFETSLWDGHGSGKLIWSAVTETENPTSRKDFTTSLLKKIVPALTQAGLIPPEQGKAVSSAPRLTMPQ
jgi:hypothetical protein